MYGISGQCSVCHLYFDVRKGTECPHCKQQSKHETTPAVEWLEQLFSLEDRRGEKPNEH